MCDAERELKAVESQVKRRIERALQNLMDAQSEGLFTEAVVHRAVYDELVYVLSMFGTDWKKVRWEK